MPSLSAIERKLKREIAARKQAEQLLEAKSLELFAANQQLQIAFKHLESKSEANIRRLEFQEQTNSVLIRFGHIFLSEELNDVILADLTYNMTNNYIVNGIELRLPHDILPDVTKRIYGVELFDKDKALPAHIFWEDDILCVPLLSEKTILGSFSVQLNIDDQDKDYLQSQMELVSKLLSSAITRQIHVQKIIEERQRAEASERSTRDFLAMINHELRTPLNGLLGSVELLGDTNLDVHQKDLQQNLAQSGAFLRVIINDLLDYSKINAGMMELIPSQFYWQDLQKTLQSIFCSRAEEKRIEFEIKVQPQVPKLIFGDLERITQVLVNLIGNAVKFTEQGGVSVAVNWCNDCLEVGIQDSGIGISKGAQDKLFQPFTQADRSSSRNYEGTGLGLAICKQLVDLMKGSISIESELGQGSLFFVTIPLTEVVVEQKTANSDTPEQSEVDLTLSILVVDDIKMNQIIISKMLGKIGLKPDVADNGLIALNTVKDDDHYDLIFMDCRMPVMDGFEATSELRKWGYTKPIVAVTAGTTLEERETCLQVGMDDILTKPYTAQDLKNMLLKWSPKS